MQAVYIVDFGTSYDRTAILACETKADALFCAKAYNGEADPEEFVTTLPLVKASEEFIVMSPKRPAHEARDEG